MSRGGVDPTTDLVELLLRRPEARGELQREHGPVVGQDAIETGPEGKGADGVLAIRGDVDAIPSRGCDVPKG